MTQQELDKLESFCNAANKTTGSTHPMDRERWFDFICLTVEDNNVIDSTILARFLQDESYWGKRPEDYLGAMGKYAWSEQLASILSYYREKYE